VHVADDGGMTWIRDYQADAAPLGPEPGQEAGPGSVAAAVVQAVARAMDCLRASKQERPRMSSAGRPVRRPGPAGVTDASRQRDGPGGAGCPDEGGNPGPHYRMTEKSPLRLPLTGTGRRPGSR